MTAIPAADFERVAAFMAGLGVLPGGGELPPTCPGWAGAFWCVMAEGHDGACLPIPRNYPPKTNARSAAA